MVWLVTVRPDDLLGWARWRLQVRSDSALARRLGIGASTLSHIRHGRLSIGPALLVRLLEETGTRLSDVPTLVEQTAAMWQRPTRH